MQQCIPRYLKAYPDLQNLLKCSIPWHLKEGRDHVTAGTIQVQHCAVKVCLLVSLSLVEQATDGEDGGEEHHAAEDDDHPRVLAYISRWGVALVVWCGGVGGG